MSLLKIYTSIPLVPLAISAVMLPYNLYKYYRSKSPSTWDANNALPNFSQLAKSKPEELPHRICPTNVYRLMPYLHQGNLGVENQEEATNAVDTIANALSYGGGAVLCTIPIVYSFSLCLSNASVDRCAGLFAEEFVKESAFQILAGAFVVGTLAKFFFLGPLVQSMATDNYQHWRFIHLQAEYQKMLAALNEVLDKSVDDPQFRETAKLARQFLRISPFIETELRTSLAMEKEQAKTLLLPLQTACRQILLKQ